jgi:hypothetical protein
MSVPEITLEYPEPRKVWIFGDMPPSTKTQLIAQKRNLCNVRAEFDRDIAKMQAHRAAIDAGIQALEAQINQMIDKPPE